MRKKMYNLFAYHFLPRKKNTVIFPENINQENQNKRFYAIKHLIILIFILSGMNVKHVYAKSSVQLSGDIFKFLIPAAAYTSTWMLDDKEGRMQFYKSFVTNWGITYGLKRTINKERPDGGRHAFPSWHTSASFQGAAFIQKRYGWKVGLPCYAIASYVGWSRIHSDKHDASDVLAGAVIGTAVSYLFTKPYKGVSVSPMAVEDGFGLNFSFKW